MVMVDALLSHSLQQPMQAHQQSLQKRYPLVAEELEQVKAALLGILKPEAAVLIESLQSTLSRSGKLFRPALLLLLSKACQRQDVSEQEIETAAVAELIHTATLLHDDVIDEADLRRGQPTLKQQQGNKIAILSGDYLLAQASLKLSRLNNCRLVAIYAQVLGDLCDGEILQLMNQDNLLLTWDDYMKKTAYKTASLFEACCESAAVIQQLDASETAQLKAFGTHLGLAFQLADDVLDYVSTEAQLGKPALSDLRQGVVTAPLILALQQAQTSTKAPEDTLAIQNAVAAFLASPSVPGTPSPEAEYLLSLLADYGTIDETLALARAHAQKAIACLSILDDSDYKQALCDLTTHAVERIA